MAGMRDAIETGRFADFAADFEQHQAEGDVAPIEGA